MADISITPANVALVDGVVRHDTAGATIAAGEAVRLSGGEVVLASDASAAAAAVAGIALNSASDGQPVAYQETGTIAIGGTVAVGKVYVLSTAGGIAPVDDVASSEFITVIGVGVTAADIKLGINASGVAAADAVT